MHIGIFGTTMCGKSTLARWLIANVYLPKNRPSLVLDPVCDPAFFRAGADYVTDDPDEFIRVVRANPDCSVFVDESGDLKGDYRIRRIATQFRHSGHNIHFMCHQYVDVAKAARACLHAVFMFRSTDVDCQQVCRDFTDKGLMQAVGLKKGEYLYLEKFGEVQRGDISGSFGKI